MRGTGPLSLATGSRVPVACAVLPGRHLLEGAAAGGSSSEEVLPSTAVMQVRRDFLRVFGLQILAERSNCGSKVRGLLQAP